MPVPGGPHQFAQRVMIGGVHPRQTARRLGQGEIPHDVGGDTVVLRVGKAAAGHLLDGVEHLDVPTVGAMKARALLRYQAELMARYHALQASPS